MVRRARVLGAMVLVVMSAHPTASGATSAAARPAATVVCDGKWRVVRTPTQAGQTGLSGVFAASRKRAWAVGFSTSGGPARGLIERWDGSSWDIQQAGINGSDPRLFGVSGVSATDVWAVGALDDQTRGLTIHWEGSHWKLVHSPSTNGHDVLTAVSAAFDDDVWAVGYSNFVSPSFHSAPLIERWDGQAWSRVANPPDSDSVSLFGVSALHYDDAWAVGDNFSVAPLRPATLHWDGHRWKVIDVAIPDSFGNSGLSDVSMNTSHDVWAVGHTQLSDGSARPLVEHWNGTAWKTVRTPATTVSRRLFGVAAVASDDVWAVGIDNFGTESEQPLIEHWNGTRWKVVAAPSGRASLTDVSADSAKDAWAVGDQTLSTGERPLALHRCTT